MVVNVFKTWREWSGVERAAGLALGLAGGGLLAWAFLLRGEWGRNPDLSHGFVALPAIWLLWRRAREDVTRALPGAEKGLGAAAQGTVVAAAGAGLVVAALFTAIYAAAFGWQATPTLFLASAAVAAGAGLAVSLAAGRTVRWIAPGWPLVVLMAVVLLSGPLPPGTYGRLTATLQELITIGVVDTLRFFGIPALRMGNVINLGTTSVGVEEACGGVRSLVSCVLAGLVLSALLLKSPWRRLWLVGLAAPLALLTNFGRSLTLTLLARHGVDISGAWHDGLGYAVLGVTTTLLAWLAFALEEKPETEPEKTEDTTRELVFTDGGWAASVTGLTLLVLAAGWFGFLALRPAERIVVSERPALAQIVPESAPAGWQVATRLDLGRFAGVLRTEYLLERSYSKINDKGRHVTVTVYVAWWPAGASSVSAVASHTPDACWPGAGWVLDDAATMRRDLRLADGGVVQKAEQRAFHNGNHPQTVWFWHLVGGRPMEAFNPRSWREQLGLFFRQGARGETAQAFVRVSSNLSWDELAGEPLLDEVFSGFAELGVPVVRAE